jgi:hypothetical protein
MAVVPNQAITLRISSQDRAGRKVPMSPHYLWYRDFTTVIRVLTVHYSILIARRFRWTHCGFAVVVCEVNMELFACQVRRNHQSIPYFDGESTLLAHAERRDAVAVGEYFQLSLAHDGTNATAFGQ